MDHNNGIKIDFILTYNKSEHLERRRRFERNLENVGLVLDWESKGQGSYLKILVPQDVFEHYKNDVVNLEDVPSSTKQFYDRRRYLFKESPSNRLAIVWHILQKLSSSHDNESIETLLNSKVYQEVSSTDPNNVHGLKIDFILVHKNENEKRSSFELSLRKNQLILEEDEDFVKIHVPRKILPRYTEVLKMRMPIKNETELTAEYRESRKYLFDDEDEDFFTPSIRIAVVWYIMERESFDGLLEDGVYEAAYPLHDGDIDDEESERYFLLSQWGAVSKYLKSQPIHRVKNYFGVKFALYFAWLGFYTMMLIPASVVGIICLIYAGATVSDDIVSDEICDSDILMCPRCDKYCDYWKLSNGCVYSKVLHFVDNPATIFMAVFISLWSGLYLELWKRYSADIMHDWGLTGIDIQSEPPRPDFIKKIKKRKKPLSEEVETYVPSFWSDKMPPIVFSFGIALLCVTIVIIGVLGIIVYRMSMITATLFYDISSTEEEFQKYYLFIPVTSALINLAFIVILNTIYTKLARWLTNIELQRTQTQYDNSLALKIYMFQFINFYSSLFYIVFIKGKFIGYPSNYNTLFGFRQEECNPGGCLMELTMQLLIIVVGKQILNEIMEIGVPLIKKLHANAKLRIKGTQNTSELIHHEPRWVQDLKLSPVNSQSLFPEYLEMVLQYGFVTIFITALPIAPLFALINNIFEMRLDAKKFLTLYRRPVPQRVKNIGIWFRVTHFVGNISIISNGFILAFSSYFIPKLVYQMTVSEDHTLNGFMDFSLSYFNTSEFESNNRPINSQFDNVTMCRYMDFRNPPEHEQKYELNVMFWHVLAARLAFVVVYQNVVGFVVTAIDWAIPDIDKKLKDRIKKEAYDTDERIIEKARENTNLNV